MDQTIPTPHRSFRLLAISLVLGLAAAACGTSDAPELTSPTEIVLATLAATESAKSTHVEVAVAGQLPISIIPNGPAAPVDLTGTTASGDLDLVGRAAHATFAVPNLFNLSGDLIALDGKAYLKTSATGPSYTVTDIGDTLPIDVTDVKGLVDTIGDFLLSEDVTLTKGGDSACGPKRCYTVTTEVTAADLATMLGGGSIVAGLPIDLTGAALGVEVRVEKDLPNRLGGLTLTVTLPESDPLTLDMTFSKWDEPVTVTAPPA